MKSWLCICFLYKVHNVSLQHYYTWLHYTDFRSVIARTIHPKPLLAINTLCHFNIAPQLEASPKIR